MACVRDPAAVSRGVVIVGIDGAADWAVLRFDGFDYACVLLLEDDYCRRSVFKS